MHATEHYNTRWMGLLFALVVILGIFFRFYNLERKTLWDNEIHTISVLGSHHRSQLPKEIHEKVVNIPVFYKYLHIPRESRISNTINNLVTKSPEHAPVYFVLLTLWVKRFGDSISSLRSLSAFISLLSFPCMYWLCMELLKS